MGADLFIVACPAPRIVAGDDVEPEARLGLAKDEVRRRIAAIEDERLCVLAGEAGYGFDYEEGDTPAETAALIRADLGDDAVLSCLFGERDTGEITLGGKAYVVTGGMSYGDEPTDAFDAIALYAETDVTVEPIRLGVAAEEPLRIEVGGPSIVVTLGPARHETPGAYEGGAIESDLHEPDESSEMKAALDTLEALVLAHAVAGVDVASPAYVEGVETVIDAIGNRVGD